jgi:hypothetical protein
MVLTLVYGLVGGSLFGVLRSVLMCDMQPLLRHHTDVCCYMHDIHKIPNAACILPAGGQQPLLAAVPPCCCLP